MAKLFFVTVICIIGLLTLQIESSKREVQLDEDDEACLIETGVSKEVVLEAKVTNTVPADNKKYKHFLSCCWKRYRYQNEEGEIEWLEVDKVLRNSFSPAVAQKLIEKCDKIRGVTHGDTVALVLHCLDEHAPSLHTLHSHYAGHHRY